MLCLTDDEIKKIIESGQLTNNETYLKRLNLYRKLFHLGPYEPEKEDRKESENELLIKELRQKIKDKSLTVGQKKNIRKRIKKLEVKVQE